MELYSEIQQLAIRYVAQLDLAMGTFIDPPAGSALGRLSNAVFDSAEKVRVHREDRRG